MALRVLIFAVVAAAGGAFGWLISGGGNSAAAAPRVRFVSATALQPNPFTTPVDISGSVTIRGQGPFGGTGSNFVCDRELLIRLLTAKPDRLRAWARVQAIPPTVAAVTRYIRALRPATLLTPTRVTNYGYVKGRAVGFQAVLGAGTAVLVDKQGAIRARCRCGNPLQDPILSAAERCDGCPHGYRVPTSWRLSSHYYVLHPAPPPIQGERQPNGDELTVTVVRVLPGGYVVKESTTRPDGQTHVRTVTVPNELGVRTVTRSRDVRGPAVTVSGPTRTVFVPTTRTIERTVTTTETVYTGGG